MSSDGYNEYFPSQWDDRSTIDWKYSGMTRNDWNDRLYKTPPQPRLKQPTIRCGNKKKVKEIVANFTQTSSLHGAAIVCSSRNYPRYAKIFYTILLLLCFICVIVAIKSLLQDLFSKESIFINSINKEYESGLEEDATHFPEYPRVTICRKPSYRTDLNESYMNLVEYAMLSLGYPFTSLSPQEVTMIVQLATISPDEDLSDNQKLNDYRKHITNLEQRYQEMKRSNKNFTLKQFIIENSIRCKDFFNSCLAMVFTLDCCDIFQPVLTPLGLCYSMRKSMEIIEMEHMNQMGFTFIVDLMSPPHLNKSVEEGFHVFFTDPNGEFYITEAFDGEKVLPEMVTVISVSLQKWNRRALHTPWHGLYTYCPTFPYAEEANIRDPERYNMRQCGMHFIFNKNRDECDCETVLNPNYSPLKRCDPIDVYRCLISAILKSNLTDMHQICHEPCIAYKYRTEASYMGFGAINQTRLEIVYNSKNFINHQYRASTFSSFISQIGGSLGLYLGASIITVVELMVFSLSWIWYKVVPARSSKIQQTPSTGKSTVSTIRRTTKRANIYYN